MDIQPRRDLGCRERTVLGKETQHVQAPGQRLIAAGPLGPGVCRHSTTLPRRLDDWQWTAIPFRLEGDGAARHRRREGIRDQDRRRMTTPATCRLWAIGQHASTRLPFLPIVTTRPMWDPSPKTGRGRENNVEKFDDDLCCDLTTGLAVIVPSASAASCADPTRATQVSTAVEAVRLGSPAAETRGAAGEDQRTLVRLGSVERKDAQARHTGLVGLVRWRQYRR